MKEKQDADNCESATCAIALQRSWAIATDDKKAISFWNREAPQLQVLSTLEIVKHWSKEAKIPSEILSNALTGIGIKGKYKPHKNHPLLAWWKAILA